MDVDYESQTRKQKNKLSETAQHLHIIVLSELILSATGWWKVSLEK